MTEYIKNMRKLIGHEPIMQCGASIILLDGEGKILLQKRRDNGCWSYHGGSIELYEEVEAAAKRELFEETGLVANSLELLGVYSGWEMAYEYPNGDKVSNIDIVYICRDYNGKIKMQSSEISELRFFDIDEIPENLSPPNRKPMNDFLQRIKSKKATE